jgi:hypothetical protein
MDSAEAQQAFTKRVLHVVEHVADELDPFWQLEVHKLESENCVVLQTYRDDLNLHRAIAIGLNYTGLAVLTETDKMVRLLGIPAGSMLAQRLASANKMHACSQAACVTTAESSASSQTGLSTLAKLVCEVEKFVELNE